MNRIGLVISSCYLCLTLVVKFAAENRFKKALAEQNIDYLQLSTRPSPLNIILWNANIETENEYLIADYSFFDTKPIRFIAYDKNREASKEMMSYKNVQRLIQISKGWYIITKEKGNWYFNDLRFGLVPKKTGKDAFVFSYLLTKESGLITATEVSKTRSDAKFLMQRLWKRIKGK